MKKIASAIVVALLSFTASGKSFDLVTLGSKGGIQDGNLTAFLIKDSQEQHYVTLDAGTLVNGLIAANKKKAFKQINIAKDSELTNVGYILKNQIKGYLISHPHLDHISGLIIASPDDVKKPIYGLKQTNDSIAKTYFNWSAWPNFSDRGEGYKISQYNLIDMAESKWIDLKDTQLKAMALPLAHSGMLSSAFLIQNKKGDIFAYFGDTGPDLIEKSENLQKIWNVLSPFVKQGKLKGMVIEVSYTNEREDSKLFGHLTPSWLMTELNKLESLAGKNSIKNLPIIISHIKYSLNKESPEAKIKSQLKKGNNLGVKFIFPKQGESFKF